MNYIKVLTVFLAFSLITIARLNAQEETKLLDTGGANFLLLPTDARSAGMGSTNVAVQGNNQAIFGNSATVMLQPSQVGFAYSCALFMRDFDKGHTLHSIAGFYKLNTRHVILGGFRYYHYPKVETALEGTDLPDIRPKEWSLDIGYAYRILHGLTASLTARWIHSDMGEVLQSISADAVAIDIGMVYKQNFQYYRKGSWTIGAQMSHLGSKLQYSSSSEAILPSSFKLGGSVDIPFNEAYGLFVTADICYRMQPSDVRATGMNIGGECILLEHFALRGGYHCGDSEKGDASYGTIGAGIQYRGMKTDFAWLFAGKENVQRNSVWITVGYCL